MNALFEKRAAFHRFKELERQNEAARKLLWSRLEKEFWLTLASKPGPIQVHYRAKAGRPAGDYGYPVYRVRSTSSGFYVSRYFANGRRYGAKVPTLTVSTVLSGEHGRKYGRDKDPHISENGPYFMTFDIPESELFFSVEEVNCFLSGSLVHPAMNL